jgi:hypothetical protein
MTLSWPNILPLVACPWTCHISRDIPANTGLFCVWCGCRAQWQDEMSTCIRQYPSNWTQGLRNACQDDWAPGLDMMNQTPTEHKTRHQTTRLWSPLSCCAAHICSAVQRSWIRRSVSRLLRAALHVQTASSPIRLGPLDAATSPPLHVKTQRDPVCESLHLLPQTLAYCCLNTRR